MSCIICPSKTPNCKRCMHYRKNGIGGEYQCYYGQYMEKYNFVEQLSEIISTALPNIVKCEYSREKNGEEYVTAFCENSYLYKINVTADSLISIASDVINFIKNK